MRADALYAQLTATVRAAGELVPCVGRSEWISTRPAERANAAARCAGCPALAACRAYATVAGVDVGVWAGQDRTPGPVGRPTRGAVRRGVTTQRAERIEATRQLTAAGVNAWTIAEQLGVTEQAVYAYRRALRSAQTS